MHNDILACERSTYPVLLHCLQCLGHDVRRLQLVNKSMCAAFRHFKDEVDMHTAKRQQMLVEANALDVVARLHLAMSNLRMQPASHMQPASQSQSMTEMWAAFERVVTPELRAIEPRMEPRTVFSVYHMHINDIFDGSFVRGSRTFNLLLSAEAGPAEETPVIEVD